jgi:hypothetical protein
LRSCLDRRVQERICVAAADAAVEVRRRAAGADERDVDVAAGDVDVAEQPTVTVAVVEARVAFEPEAGSRGEEPRELGRRGVPMTFDPELGRVHLHEPDAPAVPQQDRVAVADGVDGRAGRRLDVAAAAAG